MPKYFKDQGGALPILILLAAVGIIGFLLISNTFNFRDNLFSQLFPKPSSYAAKPSPSLGMNLISETIRGYAPTDCYHEDSAALLKNGKIVACVEQERFSRKRHTKFSMIDNSDIIPFEAIDFCLSKAGIKFRDVDLIGYTLDPYSRFMRNVEYESPYPIPNGEWGTRDGELTFYSHNLCN